jgi:hypothetical protein
MKTINLFEVGDYVELISTSYEDGGLVYGDKGEVEEIYNYKFGQDILVRWEGAPKSWVDSSDCTIWR